MHTRRIATLVGAIVMMGNQGFLLADQRPASFAADLAAAISVERLKDRAALDLAHWLGDPAVLERVLDAVRVQQSLPLDATLDLLPSEAKQRPWVKSLQNQHLTRGLFELWLFEPRVAMKTASSEGLLVAYAPAGDESKWSYVPAYLLGKPGKGIVRLDPHSPPTTPVLVVETHGRLQMREGIRRANKLLRLAQAKTSAVKNKRQASAKGTWTVRLDRIHLVDDQEPWVLGDAELYAIASGVVGDNDPVLRLVEMPYLDHDGDTYTPYQIILNWADYRYQAANFQLFEHDDNTNYQGLVMALVAAIGAAGSLAGYPEVAAITEIANRILEVMPSHWLTNDDDYVDTFYTVEKGKSYINHVGAARNAKVTLTPFFLESND